MMPALLMGETVDERDDRLVPVLLHRGNAAVAWVALVDAGQRAAAATVLDARVILARYARVESLMVALDPEAADVVLAMLNRASDAPLTVLGVTGAPEGVVVGLDLMESRSVGADPTNLVCAAALFGSPLLAPEDER